MNAEISQVQRVRFKDPATNYTNLTNKIQFLEGELGLFV